MLYVVGLRLGDEKDITLIRKCDKVYMEAYTSLLSFGLNATGISYLLTMKEGIACVGLARLGTEDQRIVAGSMSQLWEVGFGPPLHCLVIVGQTHPMEEEMPDYYRLVGSSNHDTNRSTGY